MKNCTRSLTIVAQNYADNCLSFVII